MWEEPVELLSHFRRLVHNRNAFEVPHVEIVALVLKFFLHLISFVGRSGWLPGPSQT